MIQDEEEEPHIREADVGQLGLGEIPLIPSVRRRSRQSGFLAIDVCIKHAKGGNGGYAPTNCRIPDDWLR